MLTYLCPSDQKYACSWEGQSDDILHHFEEEHDDLLHFSDTFIINLSITSENRLLFVEDEIYLVQIRLYEKNLEMKLRYLGPKMIAERISYNILLRINYDLCHPSYILVTENGSISVNLEKVEQDLGEITSLECTFNINKDLVEESDDVFTKHIQQNEETTKPEEYEDVGVNEEENIENSLPYMPLPNRKLSLDDRIPKSVTKHQEISLSRSKTISLDDVKRRNLKRAKSTVSLGAISEVDTDLSPNCTECGNTLIPPIFLCPCGHSFCQHCQPVVCKICSERVTFERNVLLEENFSKFLLPCKYKKYGCPQKLVYNELNDHETNCTFCDYQCPIDSCYFEGQFKHVCKHIKLIHGATKVLESFIVVFQTIPEAFLVNEEKGIFYCYVKYFEDSVKWEAKFCGPKERRFFCELKFKEGRLKHPVLLTRTDNVYNSTMSLQELKKLKVKAKNAVLTITC